MTVGSDSQRVWESVSFLDQDLVTDTAPGRIEVDIVRASKAFDGSILLQILGGLVLYVMIEGEDRLSWIMYAGSTDRLEPGHMHEL
jgi:hypothetical protein